MKIKEILATTANKMAHKAMDNQFEDYKQQLIERITESANEGKFSLDVNTRSFSGAWGRLKQWLESLGFVVVGWKAHNWIATIEWDDLYIAKIDMMTEPKPVVSRIEFGWKYDPAQCDFVCSGCDKHSEYTTDYCPNCGVKTYVPVGEKQRKY